MAEATISSDAAILGWRAVEAMDQIEMNPEGVFWLFDAVSTKWRFYVVTSFFDKYGARTLYLRLNLAMPKFMSEVEWAGIECFLGSPRERLAAAIRAHYADEADSATPRRVMIEGPYGDIPAYVYRMRSPHSGSESQRFRLAVKKALAA